jgi:uncharacterized protein
MPENHSKLDSIALIAHLVARAPTRPGRTSLMKCLFFLKVLKNLPLPYNFGLYTYGPFDSDVLDDLQYAEALGAVKGSLVAYPRGRGYEYLRGPKIKEVEKQSQEFLSRHKESIDWVLKEFGKRSAIDLEMASTLVYIDRAIAGNEKRAKTTIAELARKVHDVKPHLALETIEREARALKEKGFLRTAA